MSEIAADRFGLREDDIAAIVAVLRRYPEVEEAFIFGSRVKGNYRAGSDVDMALKGGALTHRAVAAIGAALNEETVMPYRFDVLDYHTVGDTAVVAHIDRVGICFYRSA